MQISSTLLVSAEDTFTPFVCCAPPTRKHHARVHFLYIYISQGTQGPIKMQSTLTAVKGEKVVLD